MAEIVERRLKYGDLPDLMLLDGGKGQVSAVKKVLDKYSVEIPLWGMYKDDKHRTKGLISQEKEIQLDKTSNLYRFVASIQEEVHNYAITYHRSLRNKSLTKSELDDIQGIEKVKNPLAIVSKMEEYSKSKGYNYITIDGVKTKFDDGFALVRASNTGPNITMRFEATTEERLKWHLDGEHRPMYVFDDQDLSISFFCVFQTKFRTFSLFSVPF